MGSGSTLRNRRLTALFLFASLPLVAGCFQYDSLSTVSWSPDGSRVAFLSEGKAWVYSLDSGRLDKVSDEEFASVVWSPRGDMIAFSTHTQVTTIRVEDGAFAGARRYPYPGGSETPPVLMWHPKGDRLIIGDMSEGKASTDEIEIESGKSTRLGSGIGLYGPDWLLWAAPVSVGRRTGKIIFDRQTREGASLPLSVDTVAALDSNIVSLFSSFLENSPLPLCVQRDDPDGLSRVVCLDKGGRLEIRASIPKGGRIFADPQRRLFAVVREKDSADPEIQVTDSLGRVRADGRRFLRMIYETVGGARDDVSSLNVSRLAFSPDGAWIAWVIQGHLCLWDWRNDQVRIHRPVEALTP